MHNSIAQFIFWLSFSFLVYTYLGYPIIIFLISRFLARNVKKSGIEPMVTVLITAYNEEKSIKEKLENTLAIEYPKDKLEILVASDGSTDRTDEIVREFVDRGVKLFHQAGRKGKTYTQNKAVEIASGEIVLFSDATTYYRADVLRELLPNFADETIGCVAGKLIYVDETNSDLSKGVQGYWNYETFIKEHESKICSLIGASGCLYAVRKSAYQEMYPEACSDFLICTIIYQQGLRSVFEPGAICSEETNKESRKEMKMRVRVISQTLNDLWRNRDMMNPLSNGFFAFELISHKLLRYLVPIFLILILVASFILARISGAFLLLFLIQAGFYAIAIFALLLERKGFKAGFLSIPLYFVIANLASVLGFYKFLKGERYTNWEPIRDSDPKHGNAT